MKNLNLKKVVGMVSAVALLLGVEFYSIAIAEKSLQRPEQAQGKGPRLIWEKGFENEIKKMAVEKGRPSAVITEKEIIFLDERGNVRRERMLSKGQFAYTSENGQFVAVSTYGQRWNEAPAESLILMNRWERILWKATDVPPGEIMISNDGKSVVALGSPWVRRIAFYDFKGKLMNSYEGFGWYYSQFSSDGNFFVLNTQVRDSKYAHIILFDKKGDILWKKPLDGRRAGPVSISRGGEYIVASGDAKDSNTRNIYCFNKEGKLLWKYDYKKEHKRNIHYRDFTLSADGSYLAAISDQKIYFFNTVSGKQLWVYEIEKKDILHGSFLEAEMSSGGEYLIVRKSTGQRRYEIYLFGKSGNKIWEKEGYIDAGVVKISEDGKQVIIGLPKKIYLFETTVTQQE